MAQPNGSLMPAEEQERWQLIRNAGCLGSFVIFLIVVAVMALLGVDENDPSGTSSESGYVDDFTIKFTGREHLKNQLRDPGSFIEAEHWPRTAEEFQRESKKGLELINQYGPRAKQMLSLELGHRNWQVDFQTAWELPNGKGIRYIIGYHLDNKPNVDLWFETDL